MNVWREDEEEVSPLGRGTLNTPLASVPGPSPDLVPGAALLSEDTHSLELTF